MGCGVMHLSKTGHIKGQVQSKPFSLPRVKTKPELKKSLEPSPNARGMGTNRRFLTVKLGDTYPCHRPCGSSITIDFAPKKTKRNETAFLCLSRPTADNVDLRGNLGQSSARRDAVGSFYLFLLLAVLIAGLEGAGHGVCRRFRVATAKERSVSEGAEGETRVAGRMRRFHPKLAVLPTPK